MPYGGADAVRRRQCRDRQLFQQLFCVIRAEVGVVVAAARLIGVQIVAQPAIVAGSAFSPAFSASTAATSRRNCSMVYPKCRHQ
jgi:hypothetical protein